LDCCFGGGFGVDVFELFGSLFVPENERFDVELERWGGGRERRWRRESTGVVVVEEEVEVEGAAKGGAGPGEGKEA